MVPITALSAGILKLILSEEFEYGVFFETEDGQDGTPLPKKI